MTTAAIYCRISEDRADSRLGVKRQEADCRALAERKGWAVGEVFTDNDRSATKGKPRAAYGRMLGAIKAGHVDAVIVWDQDRLVRHPRELESFFDVCDAAALTQLASVGGDVDLSTGEGLLVARIKGAVAAEEARKLSVRQSRKHRELAETGRWAGGGRPFGYRSATRDDGGRTLVIEPDEAELIRDAAERIIRGAPMARITADWMSRGVRGTRGAVRWSADDLRRVLTTPRIAGLRDHNGRVIGAAEWPAILDEATWQRLRAALADPRRRQPARSYLLSGLLFCGRCGERLHAQARYDRRSSWARRGYFCRPDKGGCSGIRIDAEGLEGAIVDAMLRGLAATKPLGTALRRQAGDRRRSATLAQVEGDEAALAQLSRDFYVERSIERVAFMASKAPLEEAIAAGRRRLAQTERRAEVVAELAGKGVRERWEALGFDQRRAVVLAFVERIVVGPAVPPRNRFDERRVLPAFGGDVIWRR